ncbi:MAG: NAD-dependent DNA ligase LigA [Myxococcota bacterium]
MSSVASIAEESQALLQQLPSLPAEELERLVRYHNERYWDANAPEIDDTTFDRLVEALRAARPSSPVLEELGESAPTTIERRFGAVEHERPMLSLDKCYDDDTLRRWQGRLHGGIAVTPKIDGVACAIRYDGTGRLVLAATRGDGRVGDDVTRNASLIDDIPVQLRPEGVAALHGPIEIRGEVYMRLSRFQERFAEQFANPRNLTAGALKQKDPAASAAYGLSFYAYDVLGVELETERAKNELLARLGVPVPETLYLDEGGDLAQGFRHFADRRDALDYEIDGVVMKADETAERERLGLTAHHPRWAIAYKLQGESASTRLVEVEWSVGRSGVITPVAVVEPVYVSGVTVTRASLHNAGYLQKLGIRLGARVEIVRRGGVIPHVERVLDASGDTVARPSECPSCHRTTHVEGDFVFCSHPSDCPDVVRGRVSHFVRVIDVLGFGPKYLAALIDKGLVREPADLYRLTKDQLLSLERMGDLLASRLLTELDGRRRLTVPVFLTALGIEEVGPTVAEAVCDHFGTLATLREASIEQLSGIHGVGPSIAGSLHAALRQRAGEIDHLLEQVEVVQPSPPPETGHTLAGKSVVFTGKLALMDRKSAQKRVRDVGGKTPAGVSAELDYLVIGDDGSPLLGEGERSSKHKQAERLQEKGAEIRILTERDFVKLLDEG